MPPIATTGTRVRAQIARSPARPSGAAASAFDGVSQIPQLHDRGSGCNRAASGFEIGDERMHFHEVRAFASSVAGSSAASESYSAT